MSLATHGYLPIEAPQHEEGVSRVGFQRKALADMTPAELEYIRETREVSPIGQPRAVLCEQFSKAYAKLKASYL